MNNDSHPPTCLVSTDVTRNTFTINSGLIVSTLRVVPRMSVIERFHLSNCWSRLSAVRWRMLICSLPDQLWNKSLVTFLKRSETGQSSFSSFDTLPAPSRMCLTLSMRYHKATAAIPAWPETTRRYNCHLIGHSNITKHELWSNCCRVSIVTGLKETSVCEEFT